ncbi:Lin1244/Lin1753 domain-containing protein [Enterococcus faecalis]|uniref:Lin1244/Lin1753 domain-containing protein n=1 Tax=Enterococcus faecalis TaxID=1351 RepID=UPI003F888907
MARPLKQGIDYFPLSVDFLRDIKVRKIKRACGPYTVEILLCLLGNIYRETGYYIGWDEDTMFLVADEVGAKEGLVEETVNKAVQVGFFNQEKFNEYRILTSNGIQKRYLEATKKRKEVVISDIYLVNDTIKEEETLVNGVDNEQSKVNKSKVDKSKVNKKETESCINPSSPETSVEKAFFEEPLGEEKLTELIRYYSQNVSPATPVNITDLQYDLADFDGDLELLKEAVNICARNNERRYSYFAGILKNWRANGVKTYADYLNNERERADKKTQNKQYQNKPVRHEKVPEWMNQANGEEEKLSPEEQAELDRQIKDFLEGK